MATTSIWSVKGWLGKLVIYVENPDKTKNPAYYEKEGMNEAGREALSDVLDYAMRESATRWKITTQQEAPPEKEYFVSGVNCDPGTAREEMSATQKQYGKTDGIVAFHGYQSFAPGEGTPEQVHEIGVKLAERLWGERYQVIVTTHLDHENHLHNHFVVNPVSFVDGKRYYRSAKDYYQMREESDRLCREYNLSVVKEPKPGKTQHYAEWKAEKEGKSTYRGNIRADVDEAIRQAVTDRQFFYILKKMGYSWKIGKDITIQGQGKDRGLKLERNFGPEYTYEAICERIRTERPQGIPQVPMKPKSRPVRFRGIVKKAKRRGGLRGLYYYYCYRLGFFDKKNTSTTRLHFLLREDLRKLDNYSKEARLLTAHRIDTADQLASFFSSQEQEMENLCTERKQLRNRARRAPEQEADELRQRASALAPKIKELRENVKLCMDIAQRSGMMIEKLKAITHEQREKEVDRPEQRRRRGRTNHPV